MVRKQNNINKHNRKKTKRRQRPSALESLEIPKLSIYENVFSNTKTGKLHFLKMFFPEKTEGVPGGPREPMGPSMGPFMGPMGPKGAPLGAPYFGIS